MLKKLIGAILTLSFSINGFACYGDIQIIEEGMVGHISIECPIPRLYYHTSWINIYPWKIVQDQTDHKFEMPAEATLTREYQTGWFNDAALCTYEWNNQKLILKRDDIGWGSWEDETSNIVSRGFRWNSRYCTTHANTPEICTMKGYKKGYSPFLHIYYAFKYGFI